MRNDAKVFRFCKSKCHKNVRPATYSCSLSAYANAVAQFKMKRNPRKLKWTKAFRRAAGKEMVVDSTLRFAARRNVPTRYDREHVATTLRAMERIAEIRARRERAFYRKRMAGNRAAQRAADRKLVAENQHLLPRERASEQRRREAEAGGMEVEEEKLVAQKKRERERLRVKRKMLVDGGVEDSMEVD